MASMDWEFLAKVLAGVGDTTAGMLVNEYQRKKQEAESVRTMQRQHEYHALEFGQEEAQRKIDQLEIMKQTSDLEEKAYIQREEWKRSSDAFFNDSGLAQNLISDIASQDPVRQIQAAGTMKTFAKLRSNEKLTPEDDILLAKVTSPVAQAGIADLKLKLQDFNMNQKLNGMQAGYLGALTAKAYADKGEELTTSKLLAVQNGIARARASIKDMFDDKNFQMVAQQADEIKMGIMKQQPGLEANPDALNQILQAELHKGLGPTRYAIYREGLDTLQRSKQVIAGLERVEQMMQEKLGWTQPGAPGGPGVNVPQPPPMPPPPPVEKKPNILQEIFGKVKGGMEEQATRVAEKKSSKGKGTVKAKYNLPKSAVIYGATEAENYKKINGFTEDMIRDGYVWADGKLYKIMRRKTAIRFEEVPIPSSK